MPHIFINYRTNDSKSEARLLYQSLTGSFGDHGVVMDIDTIPPAVDFKAFLDRAVAECDVFLPLIGPRWINSDKLADPSDWVRIEIESALAHGKAIMPIFVNEGRMPALEHLPESLRPFAHKNGLPLDTGRDYHVHVTRIIEWIERLRGERTAQDNTNLAHELDLNGFINGTMTRDDRLPFFVKQIGLGNARSNFKTAQFDTYSEVWRSLQALRLAGDNLWKEASNENLAAFATQLRETTATVRSGEIFFEDVDRANLLEVLDEFSKYKFEKTKLVEFDRLGDYFINKERYSIGKIREQIATNRQHKSRYESILDNIRVSFRSRLSSLNT